MRFVLRSKHHQSAAEKVIDKAASNAKNAAVIKPGKYWVGARPTKTMKDRIGKWLRYSVYEISESA